MEKARRIKGELKFGKGNIYIYIYIHIYDDGMGPSGP